MQAKRVCVVGCNIEEEIIKRNFSETLGDNKH